ncbi:MAG: hypothetical protein JNM84_15755 [Planctomycetes bacterium]|nr:hypothetical protein [Planctomycetota bacterium]
MRAMILVGAPVAAGFPVVVFARAPHETKFRLHCSAGATEDVVDLTPLAPLVPEASSLVSDLRRREMHVLRAMAPGSHGGGELRLEVRAPERTEPLARRVVRRLPKSLAEGEELTLALGSCFYRFTGGGALLRRALLREWAGSRFDVLLGLGDNLYLDIAPGQLFEGGGAVIETLDRYEQYIFGERLEAAADPRGPLECLPLLLSCDDHEFWNNYPEQQLHLSRTSGAHYGAFRSAARACFDLFQQSVNPEPVMPWKIAKGEHGRSFSLELAGIPTFVADTRSAREQHHTDGSALMFSEEELLAFEDWARKLEFPGLFVLGQPLTQLRGSRTVDFTPVDFGAQFVRILQALRSAQSEILVISGDVHFSRLAWFDASGMYGGESRRIPELICSPICHIPSSLSSVLSSTLGFGGNIGRGALTAPLEIEATDRSRHLVQREKLRLLDYEYGSSAPQCLGFLRLRRGPSESLDADVGFLDLATQDWASAEDLELDRTHWHGTWKPRRWQSHRRCFERSVLRLHAGVRR